VIVNPEKIKIGIDEVGRGCFAGPVVACAVCFDKENIIENGKFLSSLDDSKKLTRKKREIIFTQLIKFANKKKPLLKFGMGVVDNFYIDEKNIREATKLAMQRALDELLLKINPNNIQSVLVDGKDNFVFTNLIKKPVFIIDGDEKVLEIQAASIIAKVFRDKLMCVYSSLYPEYGFEKNAGYGTDKHREKIIMKEDLTGIHRLSFKPVKEVLNKKSKLLLHICCGPDACVPIVDYKDKYEIIAYWYDPNIHPRKEYLKRLNAFKKICKIEKVDLIEGPYEVKKFLTSIKGFENTPEKGEKCFQCYRLRLQESAKKANELNCEYLTTTLYMSPLKDIEKLTRIGEEISEKYNLKYLPLIFRKKNGFLRSVDYCKEYDIYRQNYCGCIYSDTYPFKIHEKKTATLNLKHSKFKELILKNN